jgi:hypothetical protein
LVLVLLAPGNPERILVDVSLRHGGEHDERSGIRGRARESRNCCASNVTLRSPRPSRRTVNLLPSID